MRKVTLLSFLLWLAAAFSPVWGARSEFSIAGFYPLEESGRQVYNFNVGWRFLRGDAPGAEAADFDDSAWDIVSTPHTPELMPSEASGGRTFQGIAWYRKHYTLDPALIGKRVMVYFEAVMGKVQVYLDGRPVLEHFGGYLPFAVELSELGVEPGREFVIAVRADNSDDETFPPGKPQRTLDFTYHGGIYRDVWMIATDPVHITDANAAGKAAGGGVFVHCDNISAANADVHVDTEVKNSSRERRRIKIRTVVQSLSGKGMHPVTMTDSRTLKPGETFTFKQKAPVENPLLWSPDSPDLYWAHTWVTDEQDRPLDGGSTRFGIRKLEFRGTEGFFLNGEYFGQLIGTNRHQDFAYVGNALPNSQQWRDAKLIRDAGCRIIRSAHYPQDPAFMDACDELGIFIIVATPGWQYWNKAPIFTERIYNDVRHMVRRDRNHASVILWEPVLNETPYPREFMLETRRITLEEYPYPGCFMAGDALHGNRETGVAEHFDVVYGWPEDEGKFRQPIFTREFGEMVDDWYAQNNPNRAARHWGEQAQLTQVFSLADSYDAMYRTTGQFIGGAQWHSFDHTRGYHPDSYYGGLWDAFRQPKYASYLFKSQVSPALVHPLAETGPMVFIAHEMSPFSGADVVVLSNCDSVRLTLFGEKAYTLPVVKERGHMPNRPVVFRGVFDFLELRQYSYIRRNWEKVTMLAEGIIDGQVVCSQQKMPSRRSDKLTIRLDHPRQSLRADGSDFAVVVCEVTDNEGNVRRLAQESILFTVEGEGTIVGDASIGANPRRVEFGSAPVLIRSTTRPGKIRVSARLLFEGVNTAKPVSIEFESLPAAHPLAYTDEPRARVGTPVVTGKEYRGGISEQEHRRELQQVQQQQVEFGEKFEEK
jgi:beta-galactosidase